PETDIVVTAVGDQCARGALGTPARPGGGTPCATAAAVGPPFRHLPATGRGRQARAFGCGREPVALPVAAAAPLGVGLRILPGHADHGVAVALFEARRLPVAR